MMFDKRILVACVGLSLLAGPAFAQNERSRSGFDGPSQPNEVYHGNQGYSFQGDQLQPSYDRNHVGQNDPRYSQSYQEQRTEARKPGGGCLKYGAAGAVGGHFAGHHGILGALAGCALGAEVRHRDNAAARAEERQQR